MYDPKGYIAGAKRRLEKARKMLPKDYVLVRDLAEKNGLNPHQILKWVRELTNKYKNCAELSTKIK